VAYAHRLPILALVLFRILWASQAATYARFSSFLWVLACIECVKHLLARKPSPLPWTTTRWGGWDVLVLLLRCCSRQVPACCQTTTC